MTSKRKIKVLFHTYSLAAGGVERFLCGLVRHVKGDGVEAVCAFHSPAKRFFSLPAGTKTRLINRKQPCERISGLKDVIDSERPDVVCSLLNSLELTVASLSAVHPHRLVISVPNIESLFYSIKFSRRDAENSIRWMRELYPKADAVIAVSRAVRDDLVQNLSVPSSRVHVVYNGIDCRRVEELSREKRGESFRLFDDDVPVIINVGSLSRVKNQGLLLKAFAIVRRRINCRVVFIGEGEFEAKLKKQAAALRISSDVTFLGRQKNPFEYLARSSVFVHSSLCEGFPLVVLEAMACGVPVICTDSPWRPGDVIRNGRSGLVVPPNDPESLARAILFMIERPEKAAKMAAAAGKTVRRFESSDVYDKYLKILLHGIGR